MISKRHFISGVCLALVVVGALSGLAVADSFMKQVTRTAPFEIMGEMQPGMSDTSVIWMAEDRVYTKSGEGTTIARFDLGVVYSLDYDARTYTEIPLSMVANPGALLNEMAAEDKEFAATLAELKESGSLDDLDKAFEDEEIDPETAEILEALLQMLTGVADSSEPMITATVTETGETRQFGPWPSRKYTVSMTMPMVDAMTSEVWASEAIDVKYDKLMQASMGMAAAWPGYAEAMEEFGKIKGMAVYSTVAMNLMGMEMEITSELIEYTETVSPAGIYEVPAGFTRVELGALGGR